MILVNDFGTYELRDPERVESALFGPCLRADYRKPGDAYWQTGGLFRLDQAEIQDEAA